MNLVDLKELKEAIAAIFTFLIDSVGKEMRIGLFDGGCLDAMTGNLRHPEV